MRIAKCEVFSITEKREMRIAKRGVIRLLIAKCELTGSFRRSTACNKYGKQFGHLLLQFLAFFRVDQFTFQKQFQPILRFGRFLRADANFMDEIIV